MWSDILSLRAGHGAAYRTVAAMAAVAVIVSAGGCVDVEQSIVLRRDLSGTAKLLMTLDSAPMIAAMAAARHALTGQSGDPTPVEIEASRGEFLDQSDEARMEEQRLNAESDAELKRRLPHGVHLIASSITEQGAKKAAQYQFDFDDLRKLAAIHLPESGGVAVEKRHDSFLDPFESLTVVDEGPTLLVTIVGTNPTAWVDARLKKGFNPQVRREALEPALKSARFTFRLESLFDVVETNATRRQGRILEWEIRGSDPQAKTPQALTARLRK